MRSYKPNKKQKEVILKWIERLRKPSSRKAREALKKGSGYCCLGHLCKVMDFSFYLRGWGYECLGEEAYLPSPVYDFLGLRNGDPEVYIGPDNFKLSALNDDYEFTLKELADLIEADWINGKPVKSHPKIQN